MDIPEVIVKRQRVNEEYGNAWTCWRTLGMPRYPAQDQMKTIHHAAVPKLDLGRLTAENHRICLDLILQRNEICLVEIQSLHDQTTSYAGMDDAKIPGY